MTIRLLTSLAGPRGAWTTGDVYECDEAEAGRLIAAGFAEPIAPAYETAVAAPPPERAVKPRGKARG